MSSSKEELYRALLEQIEAVIADTDDLIANLANAAAALKQAFKKFNWVGFYRTTAPNLLTVGPFQGPPACVHIPFDQGVCGASARTQKTVLVPDVEKFPGHIACSALSKSEIVVPLVHNGRHSSFSISTVMSLMPSIRPTRSIWSLSSPRSPRRISAMLTKFPGIREHRRDAYDTLGLATCVALRPSEKYHRRPACVFEMMVQICKGLWGKSGFQAFDGRR
jgi:L-methionine (R)-S-oxide reductase